MKSKLLSFLKSYRFQVLILLITTLLFIVNYLPKTYLTGWDNLQTELFPWLNLKRSFFAVWQEYQSFGLVSGLAHASDLIRSVFIWLISFILPQNVIRYVFHILMLFIGGLGLFTLLNTLWFKDKKIYSFIGALFYMFNLGTIQIFYVPYEAFSVFFAFLPLEIWGFLKLLESKNKSNLFLFILINFLATPQSYVQTLFLVYISILFCIVLGRTIETRSFLPVKMSILPFVLILFINSFWILPQTYFLKIQGNVVKDAKINQLANDNLFYENREKGTISNFLKMEGFYFDLSRSNQKPLFLEWKNHFNNNYFMFLQYFIAFVILLGIFKKKKYNYSLLLIYVLVLIALLNATPPFSWINDLLRQNDFVNRVFRSPFTKFIIPYSLLASIFFASGIKVITDFLYRFRLEIFKKYILLLVLLIIFLYSLPTFQGFLFSPSVKVSIPKEYIELTEYFKSIDKNKRITLLPDYTFWGWFYTRWGYDGSGFLWYGIEQPIVSRTFDVWSNKSESYFWEMKAALEAESVNEFEKILEKYNIDYLILDKSLLPISSTIRGLQYDRIEAMLSQSKNIQYIKKWKDLSLFEIKHPKKIENFISFSSLLPNIGPQIKITNKDIAYLNIGDYQTNIFKDYDKYFPFLDFMTQTNIAGKTWNIKEDNKNFEITRIMDLGSNNYNLATLSANIKQGLFAELGINGKGSIFITLPKEIAQTFNINSTEIDNCGLNKGNINVSKKHSLINIITSEGATACFNYDGPKLEQRDGYLVKLNSSYNKGRNLFFYILDKTKKQGYIETRLENGTEYHLISPRYYYGLGFSFNFQSNSYRNLISSNSLTALSIYKFPVDEIKNVTLINNNYQEKNTKYYDSFNSKKKNYYTYDINIEPSTPGILTLYQTYDSGWKAYEMKSPLSKTFPFLFGKQLKEHVLVNNWANGWVVNDKVDINDVKIIFWPQYLEYLGFLFLIFSFVWMIFWKKKS